MNDLSRELLLRAKSLVESQTDELRDSITQDCMADIAALAFACQYWMLAMDDLETRANLLQNLIQTAYTLGFLAGQETPRLDRDIWGGE